MLLHRMVSRETPVAAGLVALGLRLSAGALEKLERFADRVAEEGLKLGLVGAGDADRVVTRHLLESAALLPVLVGSDVVDVGSGGGFPGIVLALLGLRVTMIESRAKAAAFLRAATHELNASAVVVERSAEEAGRGDLRESVTSASARALAPIPVALELTLPFVCVGGRVAILVGPSFDRWRSAASAASGVLGGREPTYLPLEVPGAPARRWVMIVDKARPTPERYPRRPGVPRRRPLGEGPVTRVD